MMEESMNRPTLVVLTPVRNEAWILRAFLEATSLWADHIIIADQMSTVDIVCHKFLPEYTDKKSLL